MFPDHWKQIILKIFRKQHCNLLDIFNDYHYGLVIIFQIMVNFIWCLSVVIKNVICGHVNWRRKWKHFFMYRVRRIIKRRKQSKEDYKTQEAVPDCTSPVPTWASQGLQRTLHSSGAQAHPGSCDHWWVECNICSKTTQRGLCQQDQGHRNPTRPVTSSWGSFQSASALCHLGCEICSQSHSPRGF